MSTPPLTELKAKRTHARRSCDVCKIRKTRCELPDLEVQSSSNPLPLDKACHRCRILSLPCVVDDSNRKIRRKALDEDGTASSRAPRKRKTAPGLQEHSISTDHIPHSASTSIGGIDSATLANIDQTLDILHGLNPSQTQSGFESDLAALFSNELNPMGNEGGTVVRTSTKPSYGSREPAEDYQSQSMKLHGRPLELVCAMLNVAYGKRGLKRLRTDDGPELDMAKVVGPDMRNKLEQGVEQLYTFHPYLDPLSILFERYAADASTSNTLLLSLVIYLASLPLPPNDELSTLRSTLQPHILALRDEILLTLPPTFTALQCLDLLAVHAPLGILPVQMVTLRSLSLARGHLGASKQISDTLQFTTMVRHMRQVSRYHGAIGHLAWEETDNWLWLCLIANESCLVLENEAITKPVHLQEARDYVDDYWGDNYHEIWSAALHVMSPAQLVGRLAICDRIARLAEVIDGAIRIRSLLETAASDPTFDVIGSTSEEMKYLTDRFGAIDAKHEAILGLITPSSRGVEAGWVAFRNVRKRYELCKIHSVGTRAFMATPYLPGHSLAFGGLPEGLNPGAKIKFALAKAINPPDIIPFLLATTHPANQATWTWGKIRFSIVNEILVSFADIGSSISGGDGNGRIGHLLPWHDALAIVVESTKIQMEGQAAQIRLHREEKSMQSAQNFEVPSYVFALQPVLDVVRHVGSLSKSELDNGSGERDSFASGCGSLIGSMMRLANEWTKDIRRDEGLEPVGGQGREGHQQFQQQQAGPSTLNQAQPGFSADFRGQDDPVIQYQQPPPDLGSGLPADHAVAPEFQTESRVDEGQAAPHGPYMNSSDRWMASDHNGMPTGDPQPGTNGTPATQLDVLLSHMFNYSYQPPNQPQNSHAAHATHQQGTPMQHHLSHPGLQNQNGQQSISPAGYSNASVGGQHMGQQHDHPTNHGHGHGQPQVHNQNQNQNQVHTHTGQGGQVRYANQTQNLEGCLNWVEDGQVVVPQKY